MHYDQVFMKLPISDWDSSLSLACYGWAVLLLVPRKTFSQSETAQIGLRTQIIH